MFDTIVGHEIPKRMLCAAIERDRIAHAYLFEGPEGVGKRTLAIRFAAAILRGSATSEPDDVLERRVVGDNHPDVVLFEEMLPQDKLDHLTRSFIYDPPDVVIVTGTTALFSYISHPEAVARHAGKTTVEINPDETVLSDLVHFRFAKGADVVLPAIAAVV